MTRTLPRQPVLVAIGLLGLLGLFSSLPSLAAVKVERQYTEGGKNIVHTCTDAATGKALACPESSARVELIGMPVQVAFDRADYGRLDLLFDRIASGEERFAYGTPQMQAYQETLFKHFPVWKKWERDLARIKDWQRLRPASRAAKFAEVLYWQSFAWDARGSGYGGSVSPEGRDMFVVRLEKAAQALEELKPHAKQLPAWYVQKVHLAISMGDQQAMHAGFNEGVKLFPKYQPLYFAKARALEPKWGGSLASLDKFAMQAAGLAKGFEGQGLYARIYWNIDTPHGTPFRSQKEAVPNWQKLNAGFADLLKAYPDSRRILNQYASVACRSNDSALYRKLRSRLGAYEDESYFQMDTIDVCDYRHKWQPAA